ncbi:hypothetical protein [Burkholderia lata]|uniref:hypothetical protein n=1 Tax=Burkholderia lata (strain ATCC 17760 / DSM 23089 / LMG 22485 / NCIMB 9086 / R18194 / 383) TaxID=482957 RepID=UPI001581C6B9|nr:hypothetical protein [Burkholderia lata]
MRETGYITCIEIIARSERVISEISSELISHSEITERDALLRCGKRSSASVESKQECKAVEFAELQANLDSMQQMI